MATVFQDPKAYAAARKKAIVALARRLAVDLWRIATGRVLPEELGLVRKVNVGRLERWPLCTKEKGCLCERKDFGTAHPR